jgi:activating signal cointegrator 1
MKAISLWQPWASLWLTDAKIHETRHWGTSHRGRLAVHAAKRKIDAMDGDPVDEICNSMFGNHWGQDLPFGAIIGVVNLTDCRQMKFTAPEHQDDMECGNWDDERFAWRRGEIIKLPNPIPYRGQQGIFTVPDEIVLAAIKTASAVTSQQHSHQGETK